jgi:hypothetical protein
MALKGISKSLVLSLMRTGIASRNADSGNDCPCFILPMKRYTWIGNDWFIVQYAIPN